MYQLLGDDFISDSREHINDNFAETTLVNSTTEVATNQKWIDGKPIYRKVFEVPNANLTAGSMQIALDIDNPETMTNLFATIEFATSTQPSIIAIGSYWCSVPVPTTGDQIIRIQCINGNLMVYKQNDMSTAYKNLRITVEFTKTTD